MTHEEVVRRLENVTLPDIALEGHRRELRAALLRDHARIQARHDRMGLFGWLQSRPPLWRTLLVTSAVWALIALGIGLSVFVPRYQPQSVAAMAINTVMANPEVRAALASDEIATVTVTDVGNQILEIIVEGRGGAIIIARVDARNKLLIIKEITYVILLGSPYDTEEHITGEEQEKVINIANAYRSFRELLDSGATINKITAITCIVSTRHLDTGETTETRERWAMVQVELEGKRWSFLVDVQNGRVMDRGNRDIPKQ